MATAATASATAAASAAGESGRRGLGAVGRRGEDGKLDRVFRTRAFGTRDRRALVHHDALVALVAIIANIFVYRHVWPPRVLRKADPLAALGMTATRLMLPL
jgi:hypothetical protein